MEYTLKDLGFKNERAASLAKLFEGRGIDDEELLLLAKDELLRGEPYVLNDGEILRLERRRRATQGESFPFPTI